MGTSGHFQEYCVLFIPFDKMILNKGAKDGDDIVTALKVVIMDRVTDYFRTIFLIAVMR